MTSLNNLIAELVSLGENQDELGFWKSLYPSMTEAEQKELIVGLEQELEEIKKLKTK